MLRSVMGRQFNFNGYIITLAIIFIMGVIGSARAESYPLPDTGGNIVGHIQVVTIANPDVTLLDIARHYDLGFEEITRANPDISAWVPKLGSRVVIPTQFILPPGPREGIVINIPQRRMFYYPQTAPQQQAVVMTFPLSIAREGWSTPLGQSRITAKLRNPSWFVPKSILEEHRNDGESDFPSYFPPGPDNPMGMLAFGTGFPGIFIHGTNRPWGVGMRTSHGCLHLYPEDAEALSPILPVGTPVRIINAPLVAGERGGTLYLSSFMPVSEYPDDFSASDRALAALLANTQDSSLLAKVDWQRLHAAVAAHQIVPVPISPWAPTLEGVVAALEPLPYKNGPYGTDANGAEPPVTPR